ncbi:Alginate lyase [Pirellulimonas nuda]|uniref:Alginate lyase n=1 Tax=Pirellulimonas nuda TaxID=2528009 RepID=A0A518DBP4_9BACT|nr:alginate lyase family protein [Pirellulimonas nuda]QDU88866.1 Alginate lyase [Pirellulimonas nuda]
MKSTRPLVFALAVATVASLAPPGVTARAHADGGTTPQAQAFVHPGLAHSQSNLDFVKQQIAAQQQPWLDGWERLNRSRYASLNWKPRPMAHVQRGVYNRPDIGSSDFSDDGNAAYTHALHWALSGDERHARKAAEIIDAWSSTLETVTNHDARLLVGMTGHKYCNAAELLRHTWDGWPEPAQQKFRDMLNQVWYPIIKDFYPSANGNWDASMLQTMIAMGVFLEDRTMFDRAVNYFLDGDGNGAVRNYFNDFGECQESGRDQAHTQMGLEFLSNTCETAWTQGVDLYGAYDNRLLKGFEYTAKYNLGFDVPYERYTSFEGRYDYKSISRDSRGRLRPMYDKVYNHYHNRKGLAAEYTKQAALKDRRGRGSNGAMPWDALMYADPPEDPATSQPASRSESQPEPTP